MVLDHIPAGVSTDGYDMEMRIEDSRDALHLHAADEHAALMEAIADEVKRIIYTHTDLNATDVRYKISSQSFGQGVVVFSLTEEATALPELFEGIVQEWNGENYTELRAEGVDMSPDYDMPEEEYKYVFHYGG